MRDDATCCGRCGSPVGLLVRPGRPRVLVVDADAIDDGDTLVLRRHRCRATPREDEPPPRRHCRSGWSDREIARRLLGRMMTEWEQHFTVHELNRLCFGGHVPGSRIREVLAALQARWKVRTGFEMRGTKLCPVWATDGGVTGSPEDVAAFVDEVCCRLF